MFLKDILNQKTFLSWNWTWTKGPLLEPWIVLPFVRKQRWSEVKDRQGIASQLEREKKKKKHCRTWKESWSFRSLAILVILFFVLFVSFYFKHALMYCTIRQHQNVSEYPRTGRYLSPGEAGGGGWSIFLPSRYNLPKLWKRICIYNPPFDLLNSRCFKKILFTNLTKNVFAWPWKTAKMSFTQY